MAKSRSIFKLQGTFRDVTFVNSKTYGDHIRAKRGTHKKAKVNKAFKAESKKLLSANVPAKIFKDAIDPYRQDFKDGRLWPRMVSMFRKQLKDLGAFDFGKLGQFELHSRYKFERFLRIHPTINFNENKSLLNVNIQYDTPPKYRAKYIDGYKLTVIGIFPNLVKKKAKTLAVSSNVMGLQSVGPMLVQLIVPKNVESFVVCVKLDGCAKDGLGTSENTKGMCVIGSGAVPRSPRTVKRQKLHR